jgi:cobalt/nickel transport system permease protein
MHIPDGYLGPATYGTMYGVMVPLWAVAGRKVRNTLKARQAPLLALGAVFSFVIMMFNIPAPGGSTGHAVGGALLGIVLGPWAAMLAISAALVVQALLFGDGGITAVGANCFNMAVVMPFVGYGIYRLISAGRRVSPKRRVVAGGVAAYLSLNVSALSASVMFGIQPLIAHRADGTPLYCPYPLRVAIPAMMSEHLFIFGFMEAVVTGLVIGYLLKSDPTLLGVSALEAAGESVARPLLRRLWWGIAALALLSPIGLIASGTAWGEWATDEIKSNLGFVPAGLNHLGGIWNAILPDYSIPGLSGTWGAIVAYITSAVCGVVVIALAIGIVSRMLVKRKGESKSP